MAVNVYDKGDTVVISGDFLDVGGLPADPANVYGAFVTPAGVTTVYTYGVDVELVRDGVGDYHFDILNVQPGTYQYKIYGTGVVEPYSTFVVKTDAVAPTVTPDVYKWRCTAVPLWRYAQRISYPECQFFGVRNEATLIDNQCRDIWSELQRQNAAFYLAEAQQMLEDELGYFLCPKWAYGRLTDIPDKDFRYLDSQDLMSPTITKWARVISGGTMGVTLLQGDATVNHTADPAVVILSTSLTDIDEIKVFHPNSAQQIVPSVIDITSGILTIYIPRCRLVLESLQDNPASGLDYDDLTNFESTVDVYRIYNDNSRHAELVTPHSCTTSCSSSGCGEYSQDACIYVKDEFIGSISMKYATYSGGTWTVSSAACCYPSIARLHYYSGLVTLTRQMEDAIIRLAHTLMPEEPCGCEITQRLWERDRMVPAAISVERAANPFGMMEGAWVAWQVVKAQAATDMDVI